jgi:chorismate synthase
MAPNTFGELFRVTTWGESHGPAIGCVIDGCPAGLLLSVDDLLPDLARRRPGTHPHTSARSEPDHPEILSGIFEGKTLGTPISILIRNLDVDSSKYAPSLLRPGHADTTYRAKYGHSDYRGGGRASARETAARVAAGAVAKKLLLPARIQTRLLLPEPEAIDAAIASGDTLGGLVECTVTHPPSHLGDPVFAKLEAQLAYALLSIPGTRGFEIGDGFASSHLRGTQDPHRGGTLGGISTGEPLLIRVPFKPASSHQKAVPAGSRHDPCIAIRGAVVIEAMVALVLADRLLMQRVARL